MSIKTRLLLLIGFFLAMILINAITINLWIQSAKDSGKVINMAGKQRILSQKITKDALLSYLSGASSMDLKNNREIFDQVLKAMQHGNKAIGIDALTNKEERQALNSVSNLWKDFQEQLNNISSSSSVSELQALSDKSIDLLKTSNAVVGLLEARAKDKISLLRKMALGFLLLSFCAGVTGFWFLKHFVIDRIIQIQQMAKKIAMEKDLTQRIALTERDEIGSTSRAFDHMLENFKQLNKETQAVESELQTQLELLTLSARENHNNMDIQRGEITQVSVAINEMGATVQEVAKNTQEASDAASRAEQEASRGKTLLEESMSVTHALAEEVLGASNNIEKLAQASDSIGGIADTISTIAEQTNLLALNAAIEAARAGEQGRGFAVVADEVRTLAQRTQDATSEIHKLITTFLETTKASVETMENSRVRSEQSVEQAESMAESLTKIIDSVGDLSNINHQIAVAAEEQTAVAEELNRNILKIEDQSENTVANAAATEECAQSLSSMAKQLNARLREYKVG